MRRAKELETDTPADPSPFERYAYSLKSSGKSKEAMADELNCTPEEAWQAAQAVELWMATYDRPIVVAKLHQQALSSAAGISRVLTDAQRAEILISSGAPEVVIKSKNPETGVEETKIIPEIPPLFAADHQTRLEAVKLTTDVVKAVTASGPAIQFNQQINNPQGGGGGNNGLSFESRVRLKRQELGLDKPVRQLAAGDDEIVDGDVIDDETGEVVEDDAPDQTVDPNEELADEQVDELTGGLRPAVAHTATGT